MVCNLFLNVGDSFAALHLASEVEPMNLIRVAGQTIYQYLKEGTWRAISDDTSEVKLMKEPADWPVQPVLILDLDGTVRTTKSGDEFPRNERDFQIFPDVVEKLRWWKNNQSGWIYGLTNQGGVAYGHKTLAEAHAETKYTMSLLKNDWNHLFVDVFLAPCHPDGYFQPFNVKTFLRKPEIGFLGVIEYSMLSNEVIPDWRNSLIVGDRREDWHLAQRAGVNFQWAYQFFGRPKPTETK